MKIALVHDHLLEFGGAERVLVALHKIFPQADVFVAAYNKQIVKRWIPDFKTWNIKTSWVKYIPFYNKLYSPLRFLAPLIWESFDFSDYDVVLSSSGWFMSKGIRTKPNSYHISYIHHPPSYLYGYETAMEWQKYVPIKLYAHFINHFIRMWDFTSSQRPNLLIANSKETQKRIQKFYRRDSVVIYPPVSITEKSSDYNQQKNAQYITVSRLAYKKHTDVLIHAANSHKFHLIVVGTGRDEARLRSLAGKTVEFVGYVDDKRLGELLGQSKAFLNASVDEEFGIAPVEAMGYGTPVIAYSSGGLCETVKDGENGFLFEELTGESVCDAISKLEKLDNNDYQKMRKTARHEAEQYSSVRFKKEILEVVKDHCHSPEKGNLYKFV